MKRIFLVAILGLILFFGGMFLDKPSVVEISPSPDETSSLYEKERTVKVFLLGDIMLDRGIEYMVEKYGENDFKFPFLKIADYLKTADIVFGNLEGPISDKGTKVGSIYSFRADPEVIRGLIYAGFNFLSLANNHAFDYGREALEDTFLRLKNNGINYVGAGFTEEEAFSLKIKEVENTKIGFLAFSDLGPESWRAKEENSGIAWISENDIEKIKKEMETAGEKVDVLIVSLHSGEEYYSEPTPFQINFSRAAIEAGADLVIGHHPHVVQKNEKYQTGYIFYSLGNFVFDQDFSEETMEGQIVEVLIKDGEIKEVNPGEIKINNFFQPEINGKSSAEVSLSSLKLEQSDTLLIKVDNVSSGDKIEGEFNSKKIDFLKPAGSDAWLGILGINVKENPGKYALKINLPDGEKIEKEIEVLKRNFPVTELVVTEELEEKGYTPSNIAENIVKKENVILNEVLDVYTSKNYFNQGFIYPLDKIMDVGSYGNIRKSGDIALQHLGVDLEADIGTPIYAVNAGIVRFSQELTDYGKTLIVDHGFGIFSLYLHLDEFKVQNGQLVKKGEIIGLSGNTGYSISPHLHFSIRINGASVDPLRFIESTASIDK
jgi:poly-gamma-glutamate capsule biosynthesis protein CapA/YwtB (metallophosphatase superfamily)/murein DD-endopeptidase MepM/ murein hydrolase activator NlpD